MPTKDDFYSDIFDQQDRDSQSVLRQSMYVGAQSEPDAAASDLKLAESTGVPTQVVSRNKQRVKQVNNVDKIDYGYLIDHNPKVSDWIRDTQNASVSHDDIDNLMEHENVVKKYNVFDSFWKSLNSGAAAGNAMIARAPAAIVDAALLPGNLWLKAFGQSDKQVRSPEWLRNNEVAKFYDAQQEAWSVPELDRSIVEQVKQGDFAGAGKTLFSQLVANAPQQAVIIASAMTGRPVMGLGYAGVTAASGANKKAQESGVDPASATIDAVTQGTIEAAFERLGTFGVFKKWESAIAKAVGKQSAKQVLKEFGKTMAYSTMAEGNEELWTQAGQDFTDYITGVNPDGLKGIIQRSVDAGIVGAASGGLMTAPAATASGINLGRQMRQAEQTKEFYLSLGNTVESSKLRERLPEKHRQYVESLVKDSPIESIYVPIDAWDMFMQSKNVDPAVVANEIGINQEYDNAKDTGTDIKIPLATWANKVVGTEYYQGLSDDIKFDPQGQTVNEVKVEQETIKAEVEAANQAAKPVEQAQVDSSQVVADKVAEQLKATGQFSDKDVKHLSSLWGSFAKSFGERIGIDPLEFFNQNPLSVSTQEINDTTAPQVPEQGQAGQTEEVFEQRPEATSVVSYVKDGKKYYTKLTPKELEFLKDEVRNIPASKGGESQIHLDANTESLKRQGIEISRRDFMKGHSQAKMLFQSQHDPLGAIIFGKQGGFDMRLLKDMNYSTFLHETGHAFLEILRRNSGHADIKEMSDAVLKWFGVESWDKVDRKHHEQWAQGFEKYLFEGKAPSQPLRNAFARFRVWLISVYKTMENIGVELSDEIRGVMDRMLATDEEIEAAETQQGALGMIQNPIEILGEEKGQRYLDAIMESKQEAEATMQLKLMEEYQRERKSWWIEEYKKVREEVAKEVNTRREQMALSILQKGEMPDGTPVRDDLVGLKINKKDLQKYREKYQDLPRGISSPEGISVDVVAQLFGYSSPDEFLDVMSRTKNRNELIKEISTQKMNDTYGEIFGDKQEMAEQANQAIHNDKREQVLRMELDYLASQHKPVMKDLIRTVSARVPSKQDIKKYADEIIGRTPLREISPYRFRLAERRAAKEAGALFAQGKFEEALNAKRRELLNYELYRESNEAQETVKKSLKNFKNIFKSDDKLSKSRDLDYVNAARSILGLYGIGNSEDDPYNHINKTKAYEPEVYETLVALVDAASENYGNYESITYDQFLNMKQAVEAIWDISRRSRQIQINDQKMELDDVRQHLIARIGELIKPSDKQKYTKSASDNDKFVRALMGARAQARRVESWVDVMDGGNSKGWFTQAIWNPVIEGTQAFRIKNREYTQKFLDIIKPLEKTLIKNDIISHELGHIFRSKAELLGAMLHTGNESNLSKLLRGRGWGMYSEDGTLDRSRWDAFILRMQEQGILTKADYDFVQSIWDLFEELKPSAQKAHKEMYGFYFNEITKDEFMTPWGKYRGGYAPAIVDPFFSEDAAIRQEKEQAENTDNSYMFPTTGRGFTKQRVERYAAPLSIDLRLVPQHINKVLRFTHIEPRVKDVGRLIRNPEFREVLRDLDPTVGQNMLAPWLQRAAQQMVETPDRGPAGWRLWRELRTRSGLNIMAGNVINTLQQFTGLSIAATKVKPQYLRNSLWNYLHNPKQVAADVVEQSDFMKTRTTTHIIEVQRNIDELLLNQNNYEKAIEYARKHGYFLQVGTQNVVDMVVWPAAYDQSVAQGNEHNQAVRDADAAVRLTQGDFSPENVSNIEAGTAFFRAFTMFYSYFNMQANLLGTEFSKVARDLGLKRGAGRMFYVYLFGFMIPAVVSELIMKSLSGEDWDKDDDGYMDDILAMFFGAQFRTATAMLPFVGQALNVAVNKFNKKWYDDDIRTSPAITMIESAVSSPYSVYKAIFDEGSKRTAIRDVLSLIGLLTGAPVMPLSKPLGYMSDVSEGNVFPEDNLDFTRGLITGRSGK